MGTKPNSDQTPCTKTPSSYVMCLGHFAPPPPPPSSFEGMRNSPLMSVCMLTSAAWYMYSAKLNQAFITFSSRHAFPKIVTWDTRILIPPPDSEFEVENWNGDWCDGSCVLEERVGDFTLTRVGFTPYIVTNLPYILYLSLPLPFTLTHTYSDTLSVK